MTDEERWADIPDFPNYQVSDHGRVWSKVRKKELAYKTDKGGYLRLGLYSNRKLFSRLVSRLVGEAFVPNPEGKPWIDHKDNIRTNNHYSNLKWATPSENNRNRSARTDTPFHKHLNIIKVGKNEYWRIHIQSHNIQQFFNKQEYTYEEVYEKRNEIYASLGIKRFD